MIAIGSSSLLLETLARYRRKAKSATMRTMHDLATLLDVRLSALVAKTEDLWESDSKARARFPKPKR
jgi:hypothetical protein